MNIGGHRCPRCDGRVYFAEEVIAMGKHWHKTCFLCANGECKKRLDSNNCTEHEGEAFCTHCYRRFFGPKGYGFGVGSGVLSTDNGGPAMDAERRRIASPNSSIDGTNSTKPLRQANSASNGIFSRGGASLSALNGIKNDACARCNKTVYVAEKITGAGKAWHRAGCFTCGHCSKRLEAGAYCEKEGEVFCKACYGRSFGPKGYGYGVGAGTLQSEAASDQTADVPQTYTSY